MGVRAKTVARITVALESARLAIEAEAALELEEAAHLYTDAALVIDAETGGLPSSRRELFAQRALVYRQRASKLLAVLAEAR